MGNESPVIYIPCKMSSRGVKLKNLRLLGGVPLVMWTIAISKMLGYPTYLSSDDLEIQDIFGKYVKTFVCEQKGDKYIVEELCKYVGGNPTIIYLRPSTPLRDIDVVKNIIKGFGYENAYSLRSAEKMVEPCGKMYWGWGEPVLQVTHDQANGERQGLTPTYKPNGYVDITKTDKIKDELFSTPFYLVPVERTPEIDTEEDLEYANYLIKKKGHFLLDYIKAKLWK